MTRSGPQTRLATGALVPPHLLTGGIMNAKARAIHKRGSLENMAPDGLLGVKKGRSAFGDITNQESAKPADEKEEPGLLHKRHAQAECPDTAFLGQQRPWLGPESPENGQDDGSASEMDAEMCVPSARRDWTDIDADDAEDPTACSTYAAEIMENLFLAERCRRPSTHYMNGPQTDINASMRSILVDWLVEVVQEYRLCSDTLYLAVSYVDRYLSQRPVPRGKLQLLGVTCLLVAAKYEEIYAPQVEELCFITENTYSREEILRQEQAVLGDLKFELTQPTVKTFVRRFVKVAEKALGAEEKRLGVLAAYLAELCMLSYDMLRFLPSQIAAGCVLLAQFELTGGGWTALLQYHTKYSAADLRPVATSIHALHQAAGKSNLPAIPDKYSQPRYGCISAKAACPGPLPTELFA